MKAAEDQSQPYTSCPLCGSFLVGDFDKGEVVCPRCGFVSEDQREDQGPEWKALDLEDKMKRVRVGSPRTMSLHDYGLSTEIGYEMKDGHGKSLDSETKVSYEKLRKWQNRLRTSNPGERSLSNVLMKISEVSAQMNLPRMVTETASLIYRNSAKKKVARSKSMLGMAAASIYLSCRKCGVERTLKEIARTIGIDRRNAARYFRLVLREVEPGYVPPPPVARYISKLSNMAKIDPRVERLAVYLAEKTNDSAISSGKAPAGLAAAYVYIASVMSGLKVPQREVAEVAEVTEVTVRNRCREILENFVIRQELSPVA